MCETGKIYIKSPKIEGLDKEDIERLSNEIRDIIESQFMIKSQFTNRGFSEEMSLAHEKLGENPERHVILWANGYYDDLDLHGLIARLMFSPEYAYKNCGYPNMVVSDYYKMVWLLSACKVLGYQGFDWFRKVLVGLLEHQMYFDDEDAIHKVLISFLKDTDVDMDKFGEPDLYDKDLESAIKTSIKRMKGAEQRFKKVYNNFNWRTTPVKTLINKLDSIIDDCFESLELMCSGKFSDCALCDTCLKTSNLYVWYDGETQCLIRKHSVSRNEIYNLFRAIKEFFTIMRRGLRVSAISIGYFDSWLETEMDWC